MTKKKPLKRHSALVELSRDHHYGLLLCWKIRTGIKQNVGTARIKDYILYFFEEHLKDHFKWEEDFVFVYLAKDNELRRKAEQQHGNLREKMQTLQEFHEAPENLLREIEKALEEHIRFEERELFTHMQENLPESTLEEIKTQLQAHHIPFDDQWSDPFWNKAHQN